MESVLRFRNATTTVEGDVTTVKGESLNVDEIARLLASNEEFFQKILTALGIEYDLSALEHMSTEQAAKIIEFFKDDEPWN